MFLEGGRRAMRLTRREPAPDRGTSIAWWTSTLLSPSRDEVTYCVLMVEGQESASWRPRGLSFDELVCARRARRTTTPSIKQHC